MFSILRAENDRSAAVALDTLDCNTYTYQFVCVIMDAVNAVDGA